MLNEFKEYIKAVNVKGEPFAGALFTAFIIQQQKKMINQLIGDEYQC